MKILLAGGAGFIGSHVADRLLAQGHNVVCVDDLSLGRKENIAHHKADKKFEFIKADIADISRLRRIFSVRKFDCVFHLAANSDIQAGAASRRIDLERTFLTTFNILECMARYKVRQIVFASSSAVYGEQPGLLSESYGSMRPVSFYGAAKLASEAYISAFCENAGIRAWILRFPNVVGARSTHGVIFDFIRKLRKNSRELLILGDGKQRKPYLHVSDLVDAMLLAWKKSKAPVNCFNIGGSSATTVNKIARITARVMGLNKVVFKYSGGSRGWIGDVPRFSYDLAKIRRLGWQARNTSDEAVALAAGEMVND